MDEIWRLFYEIDEKADRIAKKERESRELEKKLNEKEEEIQTLKGKNTELLKKIDKIEREKKDLALAKVLSLSRKDAGKALRDIIEKVDDCIAKMEDLNGREK